VATGQPRPDSRGSGLALVRVPRARTRDKWKVRWRDGDKQRSKTFDRKEDAEAYQAKITLAKRRDDLADLDAGRDRFDSFTQRWWQIYGDVQLSAKTRKMYGDLLRLYLTPELGKLQLRQIDSLRIAKLQSDMLKRGVGKETTRKSLALLQGMLERAVEWRLLSSNPAKSVRKPSQRRQREANVVAPTTVEAMRRVLLAEDQLASATLISVLAYAGLRPGEALALTWADVGAKSIRVNKAVSSGEVGETKTGAARSVELLPALAGDLKEWQKASGNPTGERLVFPRRDGEAWRETDWRNWRRRVFVPTAEAAGWDSKRPYDLRHSLASLLLAEHRNPIEVAQIMGHSPDVLFSSYAAVMPELLGRPKQSATALITKARRTRRSPNVPQKAASVSNRSPARAKK
jgi:integrase